MCCLKKKIVSFETPLSIDTCTFCLYNIMENLSVDVYKREKEYGCISIDEIRYAQQVKL